MCERSSRSDHSNGGAGSSSHQHEGAIGTQGSAGFDLRRNNELSFRLLPDSIPDDVSEVTWRMGSEGRSTMPSFGPEDHLFDLSSEENVFKSLYNDDDGGDSQSHPLASGMSRLSLDESQGLYDDDNDGEKSVDTTNTSPKNNNERFNLLDLCSGKILADELTDNMTNDAVIRATNDEETSRKDRHPNRTKPRKGGRKPRFRKGQKPIDNEGGGGSAGEQSRASSSPLSSTGEKTQEKTTESL